MGIFVVCQFCNNTVDFDRIEDYEDHNICTKCLDSVPNHVPAQQSYYWLKKNKAGLLKR
jgi:hypothetical protein